MKKTVRFFCLALMVTLAACSSKPKVEMPADLIPEDTMAFLISEQLVIESTIFNAPPEYDRNALAREFYSQFFDQYGISVPRYQSSISYYFSDKDRMSGIMSRAKARIDERRAAIPAQ